MPLSICRIALNYEVVKQTLHDAVAQDSISKCPGPLTILTVEKENELADYCLNMQNIGFGLTRAAFETLITTKLIVKELENSENVKCKKIEDTRLKKE
ncbi:7980_t:CDS:2 [Cetraspora pellucida]|uniref:7980_t:CDS:1 n=1 Tax=Cetraspora pellucida TaxID=1433469 RepID=A0ACA9LJE7_9GLOM|nr:7980_t:CDS:2 [Cetraspora pellucida]